MLKMRKQPTIWHLNPNDTMLLHVVTAIYLYINSRNKHNLSDTSNYTALPRFSQKFQFSVDSNYCCKIYSNGVVSYNLWNKLAGIRKLSQMSVECNFSLIDVVFFRVLEYLYRLKRHKSNPINNKSGDWFQRISRVIVESFGLCVFKRWQKKSCSTEISNESMYKTCETLNSFCM